MSLDNPTIWEALSQGEHFHFGKYGTFMHRFSISQWRWALTLCKFEDHWSIHIFCFWIELMRPKNEPEEMMDRYGIDIYFDDRYISLGWGNKSKLIHFPWAYDNARWYQGRRDGDFDLVDHCFYRSEEMPPMYYRETFPYRYVLKNGEVQERTAIVDIHRITWCWRSWPFNRLYWPKKVLTSINVNFSDEVGEKTGSWKGGVTGCGYELKPGESPEVCLRRMESERTF